MARRSLTFKNHLMIMVWLPCKTYFILEFRSPNPPPPLRYREDPDSINNGFWYAHMGWTFAHYPSAEPDFKNVPDLLNDKLVMFQHKYYVALVISVHMGIYYQLVGL